MAKENVKKFLEELSTNKELQEKFLAAQKGYEAEGKSEEEIFEDIVLPIAKEVGYEFTVSEYHIVQREAMAEKGISEEELENVSGGWGACWGVGISSSWFSFCFTLGYDGETDGVEGLGAGANVCMYVGLGTGITL